MGGFKLENGLNREKHEANLLLQGRQQMKKDGEKMANRLG